MELFRSQNKIHIAIYTKLYILHMYAQIYVHIDIYIYEISTNVCVYKTISVTLLLLCILLSMCFLCAHVLKNLNMDFIQ